MTLHTWWLFVMMSFVVSGTPGPNMLLVMSSSAHYGMRKALPAMAGCMAALMAMMSISAAGLGALLQLSGCVRCIAMDGGCLSDLPRRQKLAHAGHCQHGRPAADGGRIRRRPVPARLPGGSQQSQGHPVCAAFLPQFITPSAARLPQFAILVVSFALIEGGWYVAYAMGGKRIALYLRQARTLRLFNRLTGGAFVGFGALMAALRQ